MVVDHIRDVVNELLGQLHKAVRAWDRVEADKFFRHPHLPEIHPFGQVPEPVVVVDSVSSSEKSTVLEWRTKFAKTHLGPVGKVEGLANTHLIIGGLSIPTRVVHGPMLPGTWNLDSHPIIEGGREGVSFGIIRT